MPQPNALDLVRMILEGGGEPRRFATGGSADPGDMMGGPVSQDDTIRRWLAQIAPKYPGPADQAYDPFSRAQPLQPMTEDGLSRMLAPHLVEMLLQRKLQGPGLAPYSPSREQLDAPDGFAAGGPVPSDDGVRMILEGRSLDDAQPAAMQGDSLPWVSGRSSGGNPNGLMFTDPEGREMPADHPAWREFPNGTREDPWGIEAWTVNRERQTGRRIPRTWRGEKGYAAGGLAGADLLAQSPAPLPGGQDWYTAMYGPYAGTKTDAVDPASGATGLPGWLGMLDWLNATAPDGVGSTSTTTGSSPQTGVNSTSNSPTQAAIAAAIGAISPVPGVVSVASMIADALASHSTTSVPGIATNQIGVPGVSIADTLANEATQTANAVAAGVATGNNAGQPGQANAPGQANNVGPTPGIGMAQQTAQQANVGGGSPSATTGVGVGVGNAANASDANDSGTWAKGGYLRHAKHNRPASHRPIRRAALGHL